MVLVEMDATLTLEAAGRVQAGEVKPSEVPQLLQVITGILDGNGLLMAFASTADELQAPWAEAVKLHVHTRQVLVAWGEGQVEPGAVVEQMTPDVLTIGHVIDETEALLAHDFGLDMAELAQRRAEMLQGIRTILEATPTPQS